MITETPQFSSRTIRLLKGVIKTICGRQRENLVINEYDPSFKVSYLGNVLTGWAKGKI